MEAKHCPGFTFRKSILIGRTDLGPTEVRSFMEKLAEEYRGNAYRLITKNCNHFCHDVCTRLTGRAIPGWVNRLARFGKILTITLYSCLSQIFSFSVFLLDLLDCLLRKLFKITETKTFNINNIGFLLTKMPKDERLVFGGWNKPEQKTSIVKVKLILYFIPSSHSHHNRI